ncbi:MAG TPA: peptide chain release factor N(5)-glutamine methyltransferase, partial [Desulfobacteraceae bacterium]|nr:peptide chain release factor N(5)-glutamine methyltransferase [Desulfobacteraceae bacterium]
MNTRLWTIRELLKVTTDYLCKKNITSPRLNAEILLAHQLQIDRLRLYLNLDEPLTEKEISGYRALIRRRAERYPLQYLTGTQEFWSLDFTVNRNVLIPRPETEILVEQALGIFKKDSFNTDRPMILDLCTGSGVIAIVLAKELPQSRIWAADISSQAIEVANLNAERHNVSDRIQFRQGDLLSSVDELSFDMIVCNPPYVAIEEYPQLPKEVRDYEPRIALDGKKGGMFFIEKILQHAMDYLVSGGW